MCNVRIIVVEEPFISKYLDGLLSGLGYSVTLAGVRHAADLMREKGRAAGVLVTNVPGEFLEFVDSVPLLYIAALPDEVLAGRFRARRVVVKPFHVRDFLAAIEELRGGGPPH